MKSFVIGQAQRQIQIKTKPLETTIETSWSYETGNGNITCSAYGNPEKMSGKMSVIIDDNGEKELSPEVIRMDNQII